MSCSKPTLEDIPLALKTKIASYLNFHSRINLLTVNKEWHQVARGQMDSHLETFKLTLCSSPPAFHQFLSAEGMETIGPIYQSAIDLEVEHPYDRGNVTANIGDPQDDQSLIDAVTPRLRFLLENKHQTFGLVTISFLCDLPASPLEQLLFITIKNLLGTNKIRARALKLEVDLDEEGFLNIFNLFCPDEIQFLRICQSEATFEGPPRTLSAAQLAESPLWQAPNAINVVGYNFDSVDDFMHLIDADFFLHSISMDDILKVMQSFPNSEQENVTIFTREPIDPSIPVELTKLYGPPIMERWYHLFDDSNKCIRIGLYERVMMFVLFPRPYSPLPPCPQ